MPKQPYIPLYLGDWIQDTDCLTITAEGAWLRVVFKCWKNNGMFSATPEVFARVCKVDELVFASILLEWETNDICDIIRGDKGIITVLSRRIRRDKEISRTKSENGSKGGSKTQANRKAKSEQIPDNDIDNEIEGLKNKKESEEITGVIEILRPETFMGAIKGLPKEDLIKDVFSDEIFIEDLQMTHRGKDIRQAFNECYIHHSNAPNPPVEVGEWKQKLNTWLSNTKINGITKKTDAVNSRREGFAKRHGSSSGN